MATTKTFEGVPWDGRTAYEKWVEDDLGLELHRGYAAGNLRKVAVKPWKDRGISAVFYDMIGAESLAGMYVAELSPGTSSVPVRQLCDEVIFVMSGRGTATVETAKGPMSFEWGPNSLFAIPLNHELSASQHVRQRAGAFRERQHNTDRVQPFPGCQIRLRRVRLAFRPHRRSAQCFRFDSRTSLMPSTKRRR